MPEGHSIHRVARVHRRWLVGRRFTVDSPQGRFAEGARVLSGRALTAVEAHGKHLFHTFEGGVRLHIHLGLFGRIRHFRSGAPPASEACRLRLASAFATLHLSGPSACELLEPDEEAALRARLGEDPLRADASPERALALLRRCRGPLALALLDQSRVSGVGNILRAEGLFLAGLPPLMPACELDEAGFVRLWEALRRMLEDGARDGLVVTPGAPPYVAEAPGRKREERFCVYSREGLPCPRCGAKVRRQELGGRGLYFCAGCQGVDAAPRVGRGRKASRADTSRASALAARRPTAGR
ncbi:Fpg/Nei family DNA glycosylase [Pyxidicoccus xibeiensis]|uniref:Fpg/Nei family DNA glycosylase n=1 Tax=Pyxidicoccus xibeiensis TaxID=2906759 RepID=UPI0020A715CA|nr:DNA-formamidopyrimidine glycosylase family protein [Pyxidicoccus xibeiensis]MCP3138723.1 DNA glycosylase [Pyxidicoccus xibeiensis]